MLLMPDMEDYLKQHDLVYEVAPCEWSSGIPLGNGDMGAVIWGDGNPLKITLDKYDVWELRTASPKDPNYNYAGLRSLIERGEYEKARRMFWVDLRRDGMIYPTRLPLPRVELSFNVPIKGFAARLSLYHAIATGRLDADGGSVEWRAFTHSGRNLLVLELLYNGGVRIDELRVRYDHLEESTKKVLERWGYEDPIYDGDGVYEWLVQPLPAGGGFAVVWRRIKLERSDLIFISILSFNDSDNPVESACGIIDDAVKMGLERIIEDHVDFWRGFWNKSFLSIPDSKIENLFYVEMYKLACCSMGKYPCSLQGVWTNDGRLPPWSGDYHLDMNVEETYWPIYASNHLDMGIPLYERFWRNLPRFKRMCREFFGFEGAWSRCEMALDGTPIYGYHTANFWPGNGAWLSHLYWLHWLYSRDKKFLRERAYPFMKAFMQTYLNLLELGDDGYYHLPLSTSPEWGEDMPEAWGSDTTCDLSLIRWLAMSLLEAVDVLGLDDPDASRWRDVLNRLADYPCDEGGLQIFKGQPLTHSHRHHSHLMPIHPLGLLNVEGSEEDRDLIERSIRTWILRGVGEWTGWSFPWASLIASRVRMGNMAWHMLKEYFHLIKPNTFHVNGDYRRFGLSIYNYEPMTLEAGFCAAAAVLEMLIQSWGGCIRVFPALPDLWKDAYFHMLRAEGAFLVTAKMENGEVEFVLVQSEAGEPCVLLNPFRGDAILTDLESGKTIVLRGEKIRFDTVKGGRYLLTSSERPLEGSPSYLIFERADSETNFFGVKRYPRF